MSVMFNNTSVFKKKLNYLYVWTFASSSFHCSEYVELMVMKKRIAYLQELYHHYNWQDNIFMTI